MPEFAGFDRSGYPGDGVMAWLRKNTNLAWCGYYLDSAPRDSETSWMARRAALTGAGWGLCPRFTSDPAQTLSGQSGAADGQAAAELMKSEGFPAGSFVYLDMKGEPPLSEAQTEYLASWHDAVTAAGYGAGVYCGIALAPEVHKVRYDSRIWVVRLSSNRTAPFPSPFPEVTPLGSGYARASVWQHAQKVQTYVRLGQLQILEISLDTARAADPSAP